MSGQFQYFVPVTGTDNKLDQIEQQIEQAGQQFKRIVCGKTFEADEVPTKSQPSGKKTNQTFTATLENAEGNCFYRAGGKK